MLQQCQNVSRCQSEQSPFRMPRCHIWQLHHGDQGMRHLRRRWIWEKRLLFHRAVIRASCPEGCLRWTALLLPSFRQVVAGRQFLFEQKSCVSRFSIGLVRFFELSPNKPRFQHDSLVTRLRVLYPFVWISRSQWYDPDLRKT